MVTKARTDKEALAWAAGFIDGEGHFGYYSTLNRSRQSYRRQISLSVPQCDLEVLEKLVGTLGGKIYKRKSPKNPNHSQRWDFRVTGHERVQNTLCKLWPWLSSIKRAQAKRALLGWRAHGTMNRGDN